ncbi:MAG: nucleoside triphosphate pyrophosphohydrolase [Sporomusaceae bacterium]|nr:nucleoside triphosphate pyrophosphohydrolase [Sporomusaceae bacterium]
MIIIAGLGPGTIGGLTLAAFEAIKNAAKTYLRTAVHPCADDLRARGVVFASFDHYYEELNSFEEVYEAIAGQIIKEAAAGQDLVFAVPGSPLVAEKTVELILEKAKNENLPVKIIPGLSFLDLLSARLQINSAVPLSVIDAFELDTLTIDPSSALVITQVYSQKSASEVKLNLMDHYDDSKSVIVAVNLGSEAEKIIEIPLYELDRLREINHLTCVYVPPAQSAARFSFDPVVDIVAKLRSPGGCAWDLEQTPESLAGYLVEEVYEVLEAIDLNDSALLSEELGDILLHVVFQARLAEEKGLFNIADVVRGICAKMVRRHPHVFGSVKVKTAADVVVNWDKIKKEEKKESRRSYLDGIPQGAPSLLRAFKLQTSAAKAGFDWEDIEPVWAKVYEELRELKEAVDELRIIGDNWDKTKNGGASLKEVQAELGDVFFALVNLARFLKLDAETALTAANNKFTRRFHYLEKKAAEQNRALTDYNLAELDFFWEEAKKN